MVKIVITSFQIAGRNYENRIKRKMVKHLLINELKPSLNNQDESFPFKLLN